MNNKLNMRDFICEKIAVTFESLEQEKKFLDLCAKNGIHWNKSVRANDYIPRLYEKDDINCDIAICVRKKDHMLEWSWRNIYEKWGFKIVPASDFLHDVPKNRECKIVIDCTDGKTTMARLFVDGKEVKQKMCRCHYTDKFHLSTGVKIAVERLFAKKGDEKW